MPLPTSPWVARPGLPRTSAADELTGKGARRHQPAGVPRSAIAGGDGHRPLPSEGTVREQLCSAVGASSSRLHPGPGSGPASTAALTCRVADEAGRVDLAGETGPVPSAHRAPVDSRPGSTRTQNRPITRSNRGGGWRAWSAGGTRPCRRPQASPGREERSCWTGTTPQAAIAQPGSHLVRGSGWLRQRAAALLWCSSSPLKVAQIGGVPSGRGGPRGGWREPRALVPAMLTGGPS